MAAPVSTSSARALSTPHESAIARRVRKNPIFVDTANRLQEVGQALTEAWSWLVALHRDYDRLLMTG